MDVSRRRWCASDIVLQFVANWSMSEKMIRHHPFVFVRTEHSLLSNGKWFVERSFFFLSTKHKNCEKSVDFIVDSWQEISLSKIRKDENIEINRNDTKRKVWLTSWVFSFLFRPNKSDSTTMNNYALSLVVICRFHLYFSSLRETSAVIFTRPKQSA